MPEKKITYLEHLNSKVNLLFSKDLSLETFSGMCMSGYYPLYGEFDITSSVAKLDKIIEVLEKMLGIVRKPKFHTREEEVVLRSELSPALDAVSFNETVRTPSFWKEKDGVMEPERVHSHEGEDDYCIYENKFICFLADKLKKDIFEIESQSDRYYFPLMREYQSDSLTYSRPSFLTGLNPRNYPYQHVFSSPSSQSLLLDEKLKKARKYLSHIFRSDLYKLVHGKEISPNIMPTNILIHDPMYSFCYRYYKENYQKEGEKQLGDDVLYYNFVVGDLIRAFVLQGYEIKAYGSFSFSSEGMIRMPKLVFRVPKVEVVVEDIEGEYAFKVTAHMLDKYGKIVSKDTVKLIHTYKEITKLTLEECEDELKKILSKGEYDDYATVTMSNKSNTYDRIATVTYYDMYSAGVLNNVIKSCFLCFTIEKESDIRCPMCGSDAISKTQNHYHCYDCQSEYSIYEMEGDCYLMIEKLWRREDEEETSVIEEEGE